MSPEPALAPPLLLDFAPSGSAHRPVAWVFFAHPPATDLRGRVVSPVMQRICCAQLQARRWAI
jgi:hypothetical protein